MSTTLEVIATPLVGRRVDLRWHRTWAVSYRGTVAQLRAVLPHFERRSGFGRDEIVRDTDAHPEHWRPHKPAVVAKVSPEYVLIQHKEVFDALPAVMRKQDLEFDQMPAQLTLTARGERMELLVDVPSSTILPPDGFALACRLRCVNSVDASTSLEAQLQWYRLVCCNGMFGWHREGRLRQVHRFGNVLGRMQDRLSDRFTQLGSDQLHFAQMHDTVVSLDALKSWVKQVVAAEWGWLEAVRTFNICMCGRDGVPGDYHPFPHAADIEHTIDVPGACAPVRNVYHVGQALSWVAGHAPTMERRFSQISSIPRLLEPLLK